MNSEWVIWLFEGVVLSAALLLLVIRSIFHAALNLLVVVICIGILYGLYGSEFLFISQIMIYGGGILILILFATMVIGRAEKENITKSISIPFAIIIFAMIVLIVIYTMAHQPTGVPYIITTQELGIKLLTDYSLPLEISGVLLLISLIGAAITAIQKPNAA